MTHEEKVEQLEALLLELAPAIDAHLNPNKEQTGQRELGFLFCLFDFGDKGTMTYISTAAVEYLEKMLDELKAKIAATARIETIRRGNG